MLVVLTADHRFCGKAVDKAAAITFATEHHIDNPHFMTHEQWVEVTAVEFAARPDLCAKFSKPLV